MGKTIRVKPFINKRTNQMTVAVPRKKFSKRDTTLKEGEELFVELSIFKKMKKRGKK